MASTETSGIDASTAPINELTFETSEIETIKADVIISFVKYHVIIHSALPRHS